MAGFECYYRKCKVGECEAIFHDWFIVDELVGEFDKKFKGIGEAKARMQEFEKFKTARVFPQHITVNVVHNIYGLVEYLDGHVELVKTESITFIDGLVKKAFGWEE